MNDNTKIKFEKIDENLVGLLVCSNAQPTEKDQLNELVQLVNSLDNSGWILSEKNKPTQCADGKEGFWHYTFIWRLAKGIENK